MIEDDDVNRRDFLKAGLAASALLTAPLLTGLTSPGPTQQGHLATLKELLSGSATAGRRRRTYALAGEASLLIGRLAQLLNRWPESHMHLSWAMSLAQEACDGTLRGHALGAMSALHSGIPRGGRGGHPARAIISPSQGWR